MTRLGIVVPSSNTTAEPEFRAMAPEASTVHVARMPLEDVTVDGLDEMADGAERAAELLAHAAVDGVAYACTTGSLLHGPGFDEELEDRLSEAAGAPAVATALSVKRALAALDAETIAVVTPYASELNDREREYLTEAGFEVATLDGRGLVANTEIGELTAADARDQVEAAVPDDLSVDAVFISCTNYRTVPALSELEDALGVPVISSNSATMWDLADRLDLDTTLDTRLDAV
ncbi:maleate cis-trans isomerase [Halorientalis sp. IM1011]|uniref:maleate cis-trans isomerase family protein n=1 Tax=Halorientalis sp. IM1011 TaxID=1932360 RepID=UPI00097CD579|nr:aspartate/glutamate racemase family protein [Halorientalis sp. IM1011]AQL42625.1 maleate cis-trans isomerase [Halorientalis sp. IM1011]